MKAISILQLEESSVKSVFVLNRTTGHEKGNIIISVAKKSGQGTDTVLIPDTFIPINLTEQVSKQQLIDSSDFRSALMSRRLQLVSSDDAEKALETSVARKELDKIYKDREVFRNNVMDLDNVSVEHEDNTQGMRDMMLSSADGAEVESNFRPAILQLVADLEESNDQDAAISTLRNIEKVTTKEYRYVYKNVNKAHKELISYARAQHDAKKAKKSRK